MKRRRSRSVQLVALGTVALGACSGDIPQSRYVYQNQQACVAEWGEPNCSTRSFSGGGTGSVGPRYSNWVNLPSGERVWSGTPEAPNFHPKTGKHLGANAMSVSRAGSSGGTSGGSGSVARGGFGSSGHSFSSGS